MYLKIAPFLGQVVLNALSRFVYFYLIATLSLDQHQDVGKIAIAIGYALGLSAVFSFGVFQYAVGSADKKNTDRVVVSQALLIFVVFLLVVLPFCGGYYLFDIVLMALAFSLVEILFSYLTLKGIKYRAVFYYGTTALFYGLCYMLVVMGFKGYELVFLPSVTVVVIVFFVMIINGFYSGVTLDRVYVLNLTEDWLVRLKYIVSNSPMYAFQPIILYLITKNGLGDGAALELMLYITCAGMVVFLMGNVYTYYGVNVIKRVDSFGYARVLMSAFVVLLVAALLAVLMPSVMKIIKPGVLSDTDLIFYAALALYSSGLVLGQWFSSICIKFKRVGYSVYANFGQLMVLIICLVSIETMVDVYFSIIAASLAKIMAQAYFFNRISTLQNE